MKQIWRLLKIKLNMDISMGGNRELSGKEQDILESMVVGFSKGSDN